MSNAARGSAPAILLGALSLAACSQAAGPEAESRSAGILDLPVQFEVLHTNTSGHPCPSTGERMTVQGHLVGPDSALRQPGEKAVSLYLYGLEGSATHFRFRAIPGYDFTAEMARLGHISVTIAMVGVDANRPANGHQDCFGSQADIAHQIIQQLRAGGYTVESGPPVAFSKVVLIGQDVGGIIAEIEAYSFKDIDGLVNMIWTDQPRATTPFITELFRAAVAFCAQGGESSPPDGQTGYLRFDPPDDQFREMLFHNAEDAVRDAVIRAIQKEPCGLLEQLQHARATNWVRLAEITVPVLLMFPQNDPVFFPEEQARQEEYFTGSDDVTTVRLYDTGHVLMMERTAPQTRALLSEWLYARGLGQRPEAGN